MPQAQQAVCPPQPALFRTLRAGIGAQPALALACAHSLGSALRREWIEQRAFLSLATQDPAAARPHAPRIAARQWAGRTGLFRALAIGDPQLIRAAALEDPSVAIREMRTLQQLPQGNAVLAAVIARIPSEAVGIAASPSPAGQLLLDVLGNSYLGRIARRDDLDLLTRRRLAAAGPEFTPEQARDDRLYFARLTADPQLAIEKRRFAEELLREMDKAPAWAPRELYELAVTGRAAFSGEMFRSLFDRIGPPQADWPYLLEYIADAAVHGRLARIAPGLMDAAFRSMDSPERLVLGGEIADLASPALLPHIAAALDMGNPFHGLLMAHLGARLPAAKVRAAAYLPLLRAPVHYTVPRRSVQRYYFYDDDDGKLSFRAFRNTYRGDRNWHWSERDGSVHLWAQAPSGRRIDIYANVPGANSRMPPLTPDVLVHRGHTYHLDKTLANLNDTVRLVYLGACRGTESVDTVIHHATDAQMFATRDTGSHTVNDPMLKALNQQLLLARDRVDWAAFWSGQQKRFAKNPLFAAYVPPHRNTSAILLRGWYAYLDSGN